MTPFEGRTLCAPAYTPRGNNYDRTFQVVHRDKTYVFDSFECAIHALAPVRAHCGIRVIGHGIEDGKTIFCCTSCERMGVKKPRV